MEIFHRDFERISLAAPILRESADQFLEVAEHLTEEDYFVESHRNVFSACKRVVRQGDGLNVYLVAAQLVRDKIFEDEISARAFIASLCHGIPGSEDLRSEIAGIRERSLTRELWRLGCEKARRAENGDSGPEILEWAEESIADLRLKYATKGSAVVLPSKDAIEQLWADLEKGWKEGRTYGITTGLRELDRILQGLQPGRLYALAARTSEGKTALALSIAMQAMSRDQITVLFISLEMLPKELALRALAHLSGIDSQSIRQRQLLRPGELELLAAVKADIEQHTIFYGQPGRAMNPGMIRKHARKFKGKLGLIVVDYLQLLKPQGKHGSREREVAECSASLKALALEMEVPVLMLSQLNRSIDYGEGREPELSDLRESGAIEQDSDVVVFLHRPDREREDRVLLVKKNRGGPTGPVKVKFLPSTGRFEDEIEQWRS